MTVPDARVRFSAEGVDEVVRAFQKVLAQSKSAAGGMGLLKKAMSDIEGALPALSLGAAAVGIFTLTKNALESADAIGKLSQKTGQSVETLSVLKYAAGKANVEFEGLSKGLIKFNRFNSELDRGSTASSEAVERLFGSAKALNGLTIEQKLLKVANAITAIPDASKKAAVAVDIFGRAGADLIPLLKDLAGTGFKDAHDQAEKLGVLMNKELTDAAERANDAMKDLKTAVQGAATQFATGLAPALAGISQTLLEATGGGGEGFRMLGKAAGDVAKGIVAAFLIVGAVISTIGSGGIAALEKLKEGFLEGSAAARKGHSDLDIIANLNSIPGGIRGAFRARKDASRAALDTATSNPDLMAQLDRLFSPLEALKSGGTTGGAPPDGIDPALRAKQVAEAKKNAEALTALLRARLDNELKLLKAAEDLKAQQTKLEFDQGLITLAEYYDRRKEEIIKGNAEEVAALQIKRDAIAAQPGFDTAGELKKKKELEAIDAEIIVKRTEGEKQLAALQAERALKERDLALTRQKFETQIMEAQGRTYDAELVHIQELADEARKNGVSPDRIDALTAALRARAQFRDLQSQGQLAQGQLQLQQGAIANQEAAGQLFPAGAVEAYSAAVRSAVPHLLELAEAQRAAATTPDEILAAEQFRQQVDALAISADQTAAHVRELKAGLQSILTNDLTDFFTTGIESAHSFGEAVGKLADSVVRDLEKMVVQMLINLAVQKLLGWFGGGGGAAAGSTGGVWAEDGGYLQGPSHAAGGINLVAEGGEYMVNKHAVAQPGVLEFLHDLNYGDGPHPLRGGGRGGVYGDGGLVSGSRDVQGGARGGSGMTQTATMAVFDDPRRFEEFLYSHAAEKAMLHHMGRNPSTVKRIINTG